MAKQKKLSAKEQRYQDLANYQVQQVMGNQAKQNLQAEFDAWNAKQSLQAEYDSWLKAQEPQQPQQTQVAAQPTQSIPKLENSFLTAEERRARAKNSRMPLQLGGPSVNGQRETKKLIDDTADRILASFTGKKAEEKEEKKSVQEQPKQEKKDLHIAPRKDMLDMLTKQSLAAPKQEEQETGIQQLPNISDYFNQVKSDSPSEPTKLEALAKENPEASYYYAKYMQENNGAEPDDFESYYKSEKNYDRAKELLDPSVKLTKEQKKEAQQLVKDGLREYALRLPNSLTPEEKARVNVYKDLDVKSDTLNSMSIGVADKGVNMGLGLLDFAALGVPGGNYVHKGISKLGDKWDETVAPAKELAQGAAPITTVDLNKAAKVADFVAGGAGAVIPDSLWNKLGSLGNVDINPYETGEAATMLASYMLTNPIFDKLAGGEKAGRLAKFLVNQAGQNLQDIVLDTSQVVEKGLRDGSIDSNEAKQIRDNIFWNAVFNLVLGGGSEILQGAGKQASNIPDIDNVVKAATDQAETAAKNIDDIAKQMPTLNNADDVTADINRQFSDLMKQNNNAVASSMDNINGIDDLNTSLNKQLSDAIKNNPIPEVGKVEPIEPIEAKSELFNKPEKAFLKEQPVDIPEDVQTKLNSDFEEMYKSLDKMQDTAEATANPEVMKKFERLQSSVFDLENKVWKSDSLEEINKSKKAADAARQAFVREMKKIDPNYKAELTGTKIGQAEYRRTSMFPSQNESEELAKSFIDAENVAKPQIEVDTKGPRPYAKNQGVSPSVENAAKYMDGEFDANSMPDWAKREVNTDNLKVNEVNTKKGSRYTVVEQKGNWTNPVDTGKKLYKTKEEAQAVIDSYKKTPGANPLQTFGGKSTDKWATSKFRTNTAEKLGWGDNMPKENYAYRVYTEAEQNADALARYQNSENVAKELLEKNYNEFDPADIKAAFNEMQKLQDMGDAKSLRLADRIGQKNAAVQRSGGQIVQASAEYNRNTFSGALTDAHKAQDDLVLNPWKSRNKKKAASNSRIASALADLGNKNAYKTGEAVNLTHDQIKQGVIAELEKEVGSVEKYFNDNDIEFLTTLAEDKSIPVWQITSEIEHKLDTGNWYTLDESIQLPKPTNQKLQNALNSLVTEQIRAEKPAKSFAQITEEVRNTLGKEMADFEGQFTDDDVEYLANLIHEGVSKEELSEMLNLKMATGSWGISDKTLEEVNNIFKQISQYDENSKQFVEGQAEAYRLLADELVPNATALEKFEAWRYLAMLGNPKTMLRNFIGNQTFGAVTGVSNNIAAIAEAGIDKGIKALGGEGIQRTKAVLNPITDNALIKACAEDADASRYRQIIGSKYEKMNKDTLRQSKSVFNSKFARFYEKLTDAGISDYRAVKSKFSTSLAGYLKANGYDTSIFKSEVELQRLKAKAETQLLSDVERTQLDNLTKEVAELNKARDYALKQAEYATFHEDNKIASVLSKWSRTSKEEGLGIGNILIEGMIPFKKTPANVLRSGLEYSPLGAIDSIRKTGKLIYENTGKRAGNLADVYKNRAGKDVARTLASDVIDSWSKTLTGTGLTALGFYLHNKGILHSSDPDTKYQDQLEGHQNYAIEINGKSYTLDWAAPSIMPMMVGAELSKLWSATGKSDEDLYNNIDAYIEAANRIFDPIIETSMLSGVRDTLETAANYAKNNEAINILPLLGYNLTTGYITQALPTLSGQIARTVDPTRRSTYTDKEGVAGVLDKQLKKQMNKIPGVSMLNQPYVDTYGREQQNSPFNNPAANLAYQMLSPGYLSNINETDADRVSREAYEVNKGTNALPQWKSSFKIDGAKLSPEDYTEASKVYGQTQYDVRSAFANDEWFNSLSDTEKEDIINDINTMAEHVAKSSVDPEYTSSSKPYEAYKEGGIPGLKDYYHDQVNKNVAKGILEDTDISLASNAGKAVKEAVASGDTAKAEQIAKAEQKKLDAFEAAGVPKTTNSQKVYDSYGEEGLKQYKTFVDAYGTKNAYNAYSRYQNAKKQIPGLTSTTFKTTYNKIDSFGDKNGSVTQKEMLDYLNAGNYTQEQANQLWKAYGNQWKKSVKKNSKGNWAASK